MRKRNLIAALLVAAPMSTFVVACGSGGDSDRRAALEREALEHELELALRPDTTAQIELTDLPLPPQEEVTPPAPTPAPQPRASTPPPPRQAAPRAQPAPTRQAEAPAPAPAPAPAAPRYVTISVPSGTTMALRLDQELSTRSSSVGSTFTATLTESVSGSDGSTVIPAGATVRGRVTESRESGRAGEDASLRITFTSVAIGGQSYPLSATTMDAQTRLVTRDSKAEQAAKIGGGAAVGAVVGRVIGRSGKATVAGAAIGAAAGTAVAMGTADVDAVLSQGTRVTIRLDSPIRVERRVD